MTTEIITREYYQQLTDLLDKGYVEETVDRICQIRPYKEQLNVIRRMIKKANLDEYFVRLDPLYQSKSRLSSRVGVILKELRQSDVDPNYADFGIKALIQWARDQNIELEEQPDDDLDFDGILSEVIFHMSSYGAEETIGDFADKVSITLLGVDLLTFPVLKHRILPYIDSIVTLQRILMLLKGQLLEEPRIYNISQNSPFGIEMGGVAEVIAIFLDLIIPWRREHAKQIAKLTQEKQQIENEKQLAELQEAQLRSKQTIAQIGKEHDPKMRALEYEQMHLQIRQLRAEVEKKEIENLKLKSELAVDLATQIILKADPDVPRDKLSAYLPYVIRGIIEPMFSPLELEADLKRDKDRDNQENKS